MLKFNAEFKGGQVLFDLERNFMRRLRSVQVAVLMAIAFPVVAQTTPEPVASETCASCHQAEFDAWAVSDHSWALRHATPENVLADFNNTTLEHDGQTSKFTMRDGKYYVETTGPDGNVAEFEVLYTVGIRPLQQYLVELPGGHLQALDMSWDTEAKRWFDLYPDDDINPTDGLHWSGPYKNWNSRCAECHQTDFVKAYDPQSRSYSSHWSELTIGCGACHGPGSTHIEWASDPEAFDAANPDMAATYGLTLSLPEEQWDEITLCAGCHSRRAALGADSPPAGSFFGDHYKLSPLREGLYFSDGQIDDEVYVLGSFMQSKMHERGVRCSNCHDPHSGQVKAEGNALCTQCHNPDGNADFPTLKKALFDDPEHHHHPVGTEGAACVSCHMPDRTYMQVDPRRDHSFRVPRPDLSLRIGTPNSCTGCHDDRDDEWAAQQLVEWFPEGRRHQAHYGEILHLGRTRANDQSAASLEALALDAGQPAIVRATALDLLQRQMREGSLERLDSLLSDDSDLVRSAMLSLYLGATAEERSDVAFRMLDDPVMSVRLSAAQLLTGLSTETLSEERQKAAAEAMGMFQNSLLARADYPETQMQIAGLAMALRSFDAAEAALATATDLDPQMAEAWALRARIQAARENPEGAIATLESGVANLPDDRVLLLQLGALYAGQQRFNDAISVFESSLQKFGATPEVLDQLAINHLMAGHREQAKVYAQDFVNVFPSIPPSQLVQQILRLP
jgi:predicted CXXCH cytochrome family protein